MANTYKVVVTNNSNTFQTYVLFTAEPIVECKVQPKIWANAYQVAETAKNTQAAFTMWATYFGYTGTSDGSPQHRVMTNVSQTAPVTLGFQQDDGSYIQGTTLNLKVKGKTSYFDDDDLKPDGSMVNAFEIVTNPDFTVKTAKDNSLLIGIAASPNGKKQTSKPIAAFQPEPNVSYNIQPVQTFWISYGDYTEGLLIDVTKVGEKCKVDFTKQPSTVYVNHTPQGKLVIQA